MTLGLPVRQRCDRRQRRALHREVSADRFGRLLLNTAMENFGARIGGQV